MARKLAEELEVKHTFNTGKQFTSYNRLNMFLKQNPDFCVRKFECLVGSLPRDEQGSDVA